MHIQSYTLCKQYSATSLAIYNNPYSGCCRPYIRKAACHTLGNMNTQMIWHFSQVICRHFSDETEVNILDAVRLSRVRSARLNAFEESSSIPG